MNITDGQIITLQSELNSRYSSRIYYDESNQKIQATKVAIDFACKFKIKIISESETPIVSLITDYDTLWRTNNTKNGLSDIYCNDSQQNDSTTFTIFPLDQNSNIVNIKSTLNNLFVCVGNDDSTLTASEINQYQLKCKFTLKPAS